MNKERNVAKLREMGCLNERDRWVAKLRDEWLRREIGCLSEGDRWVAKCSERVGG
jgi:hypothetical protein